MERWKRWARQLKTELTALYYAYRDPRTPWYARVFALVVVGYAFSPLDLIPDPIPILGYVDDLILLPLGIYIAIHLVPADVLAACREQARDGHLDHPVSWAAAAIIVLLWLLAITAIAIWVARVL